MKYPPCAKCCGNKQKSLFSENSSKPILHAAESASALFSSLTPTNPSDPVCLLALLILARKAHSVSCEALRKPAQFFSPGISMQDQPSLGRGTRTGELVTAELDLRAEGGMGLLWKFASHVFLPLSLGFSPGSHESSMIPASKPCLHPRDPIYAHQKCPVP